MMNTEAKTSLLSRLVRRGGVAALAAFLTIGTAQAQDKFYFWVTEHPAFQQKESFVIEVDAAIKAKIDSIYANRGVPGFGGRIAAGTVDYNKDYYAPGQPVWNWHFVSVDSVFDHNTTYFPQVVLPYYDANPSDIAKDPEQWIRQNGDGYLPRRYFIRQQIDPSKKDAVANVSNRGMTGAGEKALITGLIIKGGVPRNIVVRALGPSLSASGIQQPAANPRIEVYRGSTRIATNADWKTDTRSASLSQSYPSLAPASEKEAALLLTLMPGTYTLHGLNEDGTEGVVLLEAYDVDSNSN